MYLGFPTDPKVMHSSEKARRLEEDYFPVLEKLTGKDPSTLDDWPRKAKKLAQVSPKLEQTHTLPPEPSPDLDQKPRPVEQNKEQERPKETPNRRRLAIIGGITLVLCCLLALAGLTLFEIPRFLPKSTIASTFPASTQVITEVLPQTPFPSLILPSPSPIVPTDTPTITPPPNEIPTNTQKAYYMEGEALVLKDNVFAGVKSDFGYRGGPCDQVPMDFAIRIYVRNNSNSEFLLRFNTSAFHAVDDVGTQYKLVESGLQNHNEPLGVDVSYPFTPGRQQDICVAFKGQIPLQATYILVTADFISGVGPVTFRKDL